MEYLKLALGDPFQFKSILGVTFTNKATDEMKKRILEVLDNVGSGKDHSMTEELCESLEIDSKVLASRAKNLLSTILHNYDRFAVVTIDSFFHKVIRSFAREVGIQGSFSISLETNKVLAEVVDNLLATLGEEDKKQLRSWLTKYAESNMEEGKTWDFRRDVVNLASEIIKDQFKEISDGLFRLSENKESFDDVRKSLEKIKDGYIRSAETLAKKGVEIIAPNGGVESFKGKGRGPASLFQQVLKGKFSLTKTQEAGADDIGSWLTQQTIKDATLKNLVEDSVLPIYRQLTTHLEDGKLDYQSATESLRYFFTFGILKEINKQLSDYREDNDAMLIADLPDFLRKIINDSDTPFIYEKVGSKYQHFLIDEFQDTSNFQWDNFKPLVKNGTDAGYKSLVVGDVKQSIYRWRGGDRSLLEHKIKDQIGGSAQVEENVLDTNFRSDENIVAFSNWFFDNIENVTGKLFEDLPESMTAELTLGLSSFKEAKQLIQKENGEGHVQIDFIETEEDKTWKEIAIQNTIERVEHLQRQGLRLSDIAILTRTQREGTEISNAFFSYKNTTAADPALKYDVVSSETLFLNSSHAVRFMVSLIRWIWNEKDAITLAEWMYEYQRYILADDQRTDAAIFQACSNWQQHVPREFLAIRNKVKSLPLYELVETLIRVFDLSQLKDEFTYLQGFQDAILDFSKNERGDIPSFLTWWEDVRKDRSILVADENDAIKVLTIHKAKGLEYPVVIIPFLSWQLDHDTYSRDEIMWCKPPLVEPYKSLPSIPLKYSGNLKGTYWEEEFWKEKISALLDNLNLLYVAFTRSISGLYVSAQLPKNDKVSNVGQLAFQQLKESPQWNQNERKFDSGHSLENFQKKTKTAEFGLSEYHSHSWRDKLSVQLRGSEEISERDFSKQKWGIEFHQKLGKLRHLEDLPGIADENLKRELKMIVRHEDIEPFFSDLEEVKVEEPILLPGGGFRRIDRLIKKDGRWSIIDFKTGKPKRKDREQVNGYKEILQQMGYNQPKGYLIYLDPISVEEV